MAECCGDECEFGEDCDDSDDEISKLVEDKLISEFSAELNESSPEFSASWSDWLGSFNSFI
jgi:hypothetical protein